MSDTRQPYGNERAVPSSSQKSDRVLQIIVEGTENKLEPHYATSQIDLIPSL